MLVAVAKVSHMDISELECQLAEAQAQWQDLADAYRFRHVARDEIQVAREQLLDAERAVSLAKGDETALACKWEVPWDTGAPLPHVISSGHTTYLLYIISDPDPDWDGTYITIKRPSQQDRIALVKWNKCEAYMFGGPNDEVIEGHRLWGKGLELYAAHTVANSQWLAALENINKVHRGYKPARWQALKHFLLFFHDETFECIAEGYTIEVFHDSLEHIADLAMNRLFG
jgi:hypothetical protein